MSQLTVEDEELIDLLEQGASVATAASASNKYRALVTDILFHFADSQLAGASGYAACVSLGPTIDDRIALAGVVREKMKMARQVYQLLAGFSINVERYFVSHTWDARLNRHADLGYRRASSDKRLNALMFPLQSWADVVAFTYLMAEMACLQLDDLCSCSYKPFAALAIEFQPVEQTPG